VARDIWTSEDCVGVMLRGTPVNESDETGGSTTSVNARVLVRLLESVTVTLMFLAPVSRGVPVRTPALVNDSPFWSVPPDSVHVSGAVPPVDWSVWLYRRFCIAWGRESVVMLTVLFTVIEKVRVTS